MTYFASIQSKTDWPKYKYKELDRAFFQQIVASFDEITNLSKFEREDLKSNIPFSTLKVVDQKVDPESRTEKVLFQLEDGKKVESVLMRFEDGRNSVCVSCQVGCPVGCKFCASGQMGFMKNLTAQEIIDQVLYFSRKIKAESKDQKNFERVTNIVFMGMGEPMLNYKNVVEAVRILTSADQFGLGARHITMSSSGYIRQLENYIAEGLKTRLAISLHAPNQKLRSELMPVAIQYDLDKLFTFLSKWEEYSNKRVTYQYTLINGVNDTDQNANELAGLLRGRLAHVNLIPMNPIKERPDYTRSSRNRIFRFADILKSKGVNATIRITMGDKIQAACGQLANQNEKKSLPE